MSGQVPNQLPQQNGNPIPTAQMQNPAAGAGAGAGAIPGGATPNMFTMDSGFERVRLFMRDRIYGIMLQRQPQAVNEQQKQKFMDIAKRLEDGLFKQAQTKDEYINPHTLENRLSILIRRTPGNSQNQRHVQLVNSSSSIGTMIPTPVSNNHIEKLTIHTMDLTINEKDEE